MMVLLTLIAVGLLSLSAITLKQSSITTAKSQAQANARLALMIALGELQKEMGPDARISAESAIFDTNADTPAVDGVAQSRWLSSYNAWGNWLNAEYQIPGGGTVRIGDTYAARRAPMFRRWLLSLPNGQETNINAPDSLGGWDDSNSVVLVGPGSLGTSAPADQLTRAYLMPIDGTGRNAWWIGPENHKARIDLAKDDSRNTFSPAEWQLAQSDTAEVGVGGLAGLDALDQNAALSRKLITRDTLRLANVEEARAKRHFFDLTAHSRGVLSNPRTGALKMDLSLLFELPENQLPRRYRFIPGQDGVEPSIRPMSPEIARRAVLRNRHFQSWTNMRHFYRIYRQDAPAAGGPTVGGTADGAPTGGLTWDRGKPWTRPVATSSLGTATSTTGGRTWDGSNNYWRVPLLAKITFIYSLLAEPVASRPGHFRLYHVYSPVFTYWNPYNVELRIPSGAITMASSAYRVWPNSGEFYLNNTLARDINEMGAFGVFGYNQGINAMSALRSEDGRDLVFQPGEFRVFSHRSRITTGSQATSGNEAPLLPGFDPLAIGGEKKDYGIYSPRGSADGTFTQNDRPGVRIRFTHGLWGGNINRGNTAGSLCWQDWWDRSNHPNGMAMTYANDWFNKAQTLTPMTPEGTANIARWAFDGLPMPVAFCQLVIKGISPYAYESIRSGNPAPHNWARDWRSRNWIHSPPFYFGSGMYCSENNDIAHTQRLDSPYVINFGPTSMGEMPSVVGHVGPNSFLGSGSNPFEKVMRAPVLELPTAPPGSLASFSQMRINPGWTNPAQIGIDQNGNQLFFPRTYGGSGWTSTGEESLFAAETKRLGYQSGVTGAGIGNSFIHPMLPRNDVYRFVDNSKSEDTPDRQPNAWMNTITRDSKAYCDYWDHAFLLNDALWDDYFVSSLADQTRPGAGATRSLQQNLDRLIAGQPLANARYKYNPGGLSNDQVRQQLAAADGYLKAARHLVVDGMFNVNSTSVDAWFALFAGIRERNVVYRDAGGALRKVEIPSGKRIAISRFNTEVADREMTDPEYGVNLPGGLSGWSGVRFLGDDELRLLAEQCVRQVKLRGPFLNYSEFLNRRLSNDDLGLMGALQSAIDFDDANPNPGSINYRFKNGRDFSDAAANFGRTVFNTPEAANGSRFAGIPGYVVQSDLLNPIANTLSVRDDTFRIRAYGDARDARGKVIARAWCEAIVQRVPEYADSTNDAAVPARIMSDNGTFSDNAALTEANRRFGRKFQIVDFRWLNSKEV
jgi:hypothetical protein